MRGSQGAQQQLTKYLEEIRRFPMLGPEEEFSLAKAWREQGDRKAADRLVTSHLRLGAKIAWGFRGYGLPLCDVISEGNLGLIQAVERFEPDRGCRLATYATWWIKAAIHEYILRSWSLVRIGTTASQKKLFFSLRRVKNSISAFEQGDLNPDHVALIAERLGVPEQDVIDMNRRLSGDVSLNAPRSEDGSSGEWQDWLADDSVSQEARLVETEEADRRLRALRRALTVLDRRERSIFEARRLTEKPVSLEHLANQLGISSERVRQIEMRAFEKVQKAVRSGVGAFPRPSDVFGSPQHSLPRLSPKLHRSEVLGARSTWEISCEAMDSISSLPVDTKVLSIPKHNRPPLFSTPI